MRLLIIGSLGGELSTATKIAMANGAAVVHVPDIDTALASLRAGRGADLALVDVDRDIGRLEKALKAERFHLPVVACGTRPDSDAAVAAIRAGARDYLPLPPDPELIAAILAAVARDAHDVVYKDAAMAQVMQFIDQVAPSGASILITGESGVGKEVIARHVHHKSRRSKAEMISVNCAAIPENLLESELFGHEKGAFTGALHRRIGKFEEADGGTLLLDEISEMDVRLQAKLLRAIQERQIDRVGGSAPIPVDIRIIATSNRDLGAAVRDGTFREDLLFRLNVVNLRIPPLRERRGDILRLARHFAGLYAAANGVRAPSIAPQAQKLLVNHDWPGNVRELENTLHRAVLLCQDDEISSDALRMPDGNPMHHAGNPGDNGADDISARAVAAAETAQRGLFGHTVAEIEEKLILETLDHCLGNRTHAARILGISIRTLRNKLQQYGAASGSPAARAGAHVLPVTPPHIARPEAAQVAAR